MSDKTQIQHLQEQNHKLRQALEDCTLGFALIHEAVLKGFYDEALLYSGTRHARVLRVLEE